MIEWAIEFVYDKNLDQVFINNFINFLISKGLRYQTGGYFSIIYDKTRFIRYDDEKYKESIKNLDDIINTYLQHDLKTSSLFVRFYYPSEVKIDFELGIIPSEEKKCLIRFETNEVATPESEFITFVKLCKEVFNSFNFVYGAYRMGIHERIPLNSDEFLYERPTNVNFYSKPLVDKIGREKLLSTPAYKVEELRNGGVMLLACQEPWWCYDELNKVWHHLGYK